MLAKIQGIDPPSEEVDRVLALVGLQDSVDRRVGHYSQGMRQRLGLAQALLGQPSYLILDEPTNGLDPEGIHELRRLLQNLAEQSGTTILLSSHLLHEVTGLCNRIGVLNSGKLLAEAPTDELLSPDSRSYLLKTDDDTHALKSLAALEEHGLAVSATSEGALQLSADEECADQIVPTLVAAGRKVLAFTPVDPSLEEIYLEFSRGDRDAMPRAPAPPLPEPTTDLPRLHRPIRRVVGYELDRLCRPGPVLALLSPALVAPLVVYNRHLALSRDADELSQGSLISATDITAFEGLARALHTTLPLLALVMAGIASQSIAGEGASGTLRNLLIRPLHRGEIAFGKLTALALTAVLSYLCLLATAVVAAGLAFDYGDVVEILSTGGGSFPILTAEEVWPEVWPAIASPVIPLIAFTCLGFFWSTLVRSAAGALALTLGTTIALGLGRTLFRGWDLEAWLPGPYLPSPLARNSHMDFFVDFASGISNATHDFAATAWITPPIWVVTCSALAVMIFRRKYVP